MIRGWGAQGDYIPFASSTAGNGAEIIGIRSTVQTLVSPGALAGVFSFARAQPSGSEATGLQSDGTTWATYAQNVPRFVGTARRLLIEGQRANSNNDPRVLTSANWTRAGVTAAMDQVGPNGVANAAATITETLTTAQHFISSTALFATTAGVSNTVSWLVQAGTLGFAQLSFLAASHGANAWANFVLSGSGSRGTVGASATARIERVGPWYRISIAAPATATTSGQAYLTMIQSATDARAVSYLGTGASNVAAWPQIEVGAFPSTPILPAVGAPAASTRGSDLLSALLSGLNVGGSGASTWAVSGVAGQPAPSGLRQTWLQVDDDTDNNCVQLNQELGQGIYGRRVTAGVSNTTGIADSVNLNTPTPVKLGLRIKGDGNVDVIAIATGTYSGIKNVAGAATAGFTTLRLGNNAADTQPVFSEVGYLQYLNYAASDAEFTNFVTNMPTA